MANRIKTYQTTDWKIWTFQPTAGDFVLGESRLGGTDVLGATSGSMQILDAEITSLTIQDGGQLSDGIFVRPVPSTLDVTIQVKYFKMKESWKFSYGSPIWVTVANAETYDAQIYGKNTPMFFGKIVSFDALVQPGADFSTINITAISNSSTDLNTPLTITKNTSTDKSTKISSAATSSGIFNYIPLSGYNFANTSTETKTYGEWLDDLITCNQFSVGDQNLFWTYTGSPSSPVLEYEQAIFIKNSYVYQGSGVIYYSEDVADIQFNWSGEGSPTSVALTNYSDPNVEYFAQKSTNSSLANFTGTVDVLNTTQMQSIAKDILSMSQKFTTTQFTTVTATNNQDIEFSELVGSPGWFFYLYPAKYRNLGDTVRVYLPELGMNDADFDVYNNSSIVIGRTINVNTEQWTTTYELWKGFDY